jgi:hypothetical protein
MSHITRCLAIAGLASAAALPLRAQAPAGKATVVYLSGQSVYVSAGSKDGLITGDSVRVMRSGSQVALVQVAFVSSHQASCSILSSTAAPAVGDSVLFTPHQVAAPTPTIALGAGGTAAAAQTATSWQDASRLRGRIGARFLSVQQLDGSGANYSQPSLDLRLDGQNLGGTPMGLTVDIRSRQMLASNVDGTSQATGQTLVYQAVVFAGRPGARYRLAVGRQYSPALATVNLFDGVLAELNRRTWSTGLFGGAIPSNLELQWSAAQTEAGGYFQLHQSLGQALPWAVTLGLVGTFDHGTSDRKFGFLQATLAQPHWGFFVSQEVDYYSADKIAAGEPSAISPTGSYGSAYARLGRVVDLNAGFDSRRNVRLYRDVVSPITQFDDAFRKGYFAGIGFKLGNAGRLGFDARASEGSVVGTANALTGSLALFRLTPAHLLLSLRATRYTGTQSEGWLYSGALGVPITGSLRAELNGGLRNETNMLGFTGATANNLNWFGGDLEWNLTNSWFMSFSAIWEHGDSQNDTQIYGGVSYRF